MWIPTCLAGLFGLLIGSFLNVCIYRWPRDLSVVRPRSHCPGCDTLIAAYDNIPVLSYLLLRGRCRHCRTSIHWRYPLVEVLTAASFGWFVFALGPGFAAAKFCIFAALTIGLIFADLETLILPDELTIGGILIGLTFAPFVPVPDPSFDLGSLAEAALGAVVPAGALWLLGWLFERLRHKEGLGFGDIKMIAMIGAFLGIGGALLTVVLGSVVGSIAGLAYIKIAKKDPSSYMLPFGTFLGAAALLSAIAGRNVIGWYAGLLR